MNAYDVIVIGARCAGAPTAMVLARAGLRVLLVDRATFPSDTLSTHIVHPPGVAALARWGLLDQLTATGCPPIHTYACDMGPFTLAGSPGTAESPVGYCPRRTIFDKLLVDAAAAAGATVREDFIVEELITDGDRVVGIRGRTKSGSTVTDRARVVVGADGVRSRVAEAVQPETYHEHPPMLAWYYSYWSNLPVDGRMEQYMPPGRAIGMAPTHNDLTLIAVAWPHAEFAANKADPERHMVAAIEQVPALADRMRGARREQRIAGGAVPGFVRKPYGPGWALVGDAGYTKDPITAQGISDGLLDAEALGRALVRCLGGEATFDAALAAYHQARDERALPMFQLTCEWASLQEPPPEVQQMFAAMAGDQVAMDRFAQVLSGVLPPAALFGA